MATKYLFIICCVISSMACNDSKLSADEKQQQNMAVAKLLFEHFNAHDWQKMAALYKDIADFKDPSFGQDIVTQTRQQTIDKYQLLQQSSPDIKDEVKNIYPSGDNYVIVEFISSGTAPDHSKWTLPICTILTIENGSITKDFTYYDNN